MVLSPRDTTEWNLGQCYTEFFSLQTLLYIWLHKDIFKYAAICTVAKLNYCGRWMGRVVEVEVGKSCGAVNLKQ